MRKFYVIVILSLAALPALAWAEESHWYDFIRPVGLVDTRVIFAETIPEASGFDTVRTSDVLVRYVSLGAIFEPNQFVSGNALLTMENEESGLYIENGFITVRYPWAVTPYVVIGTRAVPTGGYTTYAIEDPLVLELFEVNRMAISPGVGNAYFDLQASFFNGRVDNVDDQGWPADDVIDTYIVRGEVYFFAFQEAYQLTLGSYYMNDAVEGDFDLGSTLLHGRYEANVPAYGAFFNATLAFTDLIGLGLAADYATTGKFDRRNYLDNAGHETAISAANFELALLLFQQSIQIGPKFEMVRGMDWLGMQANDPSYKITSYNRYGGFAGYDPWPFLHVGARYLAGADNEGNRDSEFQFQTALYF